MAFLILPILLLSCLINRPYTRIEHGLLGTFLEIKVWEKNPIKAEEAISKAVERVKEIHKRFSVFDEKSEVYRLNKCGRGHVSKEVRSLIETSIKYSKLSDGAFDITIYPLVEIWRKAKNEKRLPTKKEISEALKKVGYEKISLKDNEVILKEGTKLDFGAIAQGYAVDCAIQILKKNNIKKALINIGGEIYAYGDEFNIGIQDPHKGYGNTIGKIRLKDKAVSTSGDYEKYFILNGKKYHHILDPKTGYPASECKSVSVISDNATEADALATAVFVLGKEKGIKLLERLKLDAVIIFSDNKIYISPNLKNKIFLRQSENTK